MRKRLSALLAALLVVMSCGAAPGLAAENALPYAGKTVVVYTGNVRGELDVYPKIAAVKKSYAAAGADVLLADTGNYLRGSAAANADRGLSVYRLMEAAGYDVAGMGPAEFGWTDATTGYPYHGNVTRYYTQKMLQEGTEELTYARNKDGSVTAVLPAKEPTAFRTVSDLTALKEGLYSFEPWAMVETAGGRSVAFYGASDPGTAELVQDGCVGAKKALSVNYDAANIPVPVFLVNDPAFSWGAGQGAEPRPYILIRPEGEALTAGAYVIDNATYAVTHETVDLSAVEDDPEVAALVRAVREAAPEAVGTSRVVLEGRDSKNRNGETNLGDLVCDAIKWYAETYMEGLDRALPVVCVQNGGNCDQFLYPGEITGTDLLWALPFSPLGLGALEITGAQLLELLEAADQRADSAGFAQVAGLTYTLYTGIGYDGGEAYGKFFKCDAMNRVRIDTVGGEPFDPAGRYTLVCDNYLMSGNDTYYLLKELRDGGARYIDNGKGVKVRDAAAMYIREALGGVIGEEYAEPQGRITVTGEMPEEVRWCAERGLIDSAEGFRFLADGSRAWAVSLLWKLAGCPETEGETPFSDVEEDDEHAQAVRWASGEGLVNGVGGGLFEPDRAITREEAATLMYRYVKRQGGGFTGAWAFPLGYADAGQVSDWAGEAARWASMGSKLTVKPGNRMDPRGEACRGAVLGLLYAAYMP